MRMRVSKTFLLGAATCAVVSHAHTVITFPGWRGNNLGVNSEFPDGMQRSYPCKLLYHFSCLEVRGKGLYQARICVRVGQNICRAGNQSDKLTNENRFF